MAAAIIITILVIGIECLLLVFYEFVKKVNALEKLVNELMLDNAKEDKLKDYRNENGLFTNKRK